MLKRRTRYSLLISLGLLFLSALLFGFTRNQTLQQVILYSAINNHYEAVDINDNFSEKAFELYIQQNDPSKRFFTQDDIATLSIYKYALDDQIKKNDFTFFNALDDLYYKRVKEVEAFLPELFEKPYTFETKEYLETDNDKREFQLNAAGVRRYWEQLVSLQIMNQYINLKQAQVSENEQISSAFDAELEKKSREKVKADIENSFERLNDESEDERLEVYFNSLTSIFDTHTNYFPAEKKEDFDINISGQLEGIGAVLREDEGFIKVVSIVPGSASWKQGQLKAEDIILKVGQGDEEPIDIVGAKVRDAVKLIRGKKGSVVKLTVKHVSEKVEVIPIIRDIVVIEETYAKHAFVNDKRSGKQFGYIYLPKFYRDFKDSKKRNTTDDIRAALSDLNSQHIEGVVLDLRNNSGGALLDAVNSAGLFIKSGPIVQVKGKRSYNSVLRDKDKSVVYDGPLVVLVNSFSASASEILAAALQDYGRAVVVGADTFGKGTVQTFLDLNSYFIKNKSKHKELGSIKVTVQKFYRISGQSTQHKGVIPDIQLPNLYAHMEVGERYLDYAMPWDTINHLNYKLWYPEGVNVDRLKKASSKRVKSLDSFKALEKHIAFVKAEKEQSKVPLNLKAAIKEKNKLNKESKQYNDSKKAFEDISYSSPDTAKLTVAQKESYKEWIKDLSKDIYLYESFAILNDLSEDDIFKKQQKKESLALKK